MMFTISHFKRFVLFEIRDPDWEKIRSQGTDVAGHKYFFASLYNFLRTTRHYNPEDGTLRQNTSFG
jgi:hypothetical protein